MKLKVFKHQEGGNLVAPAAESAAPAPEMNAPAQENPEEQIAQLAGQLLESLLQSLGNPEAVMAVLQAAMDMLQEAAGQSAPVFKCGGKMVKKSKKACGGKMKK